MPVESQAWSMILSHLILGEFQPIRITQGRHSKSNLTAYRGTARTIPMICYNNTETNGATQSSSNASDTATGEIWVGGANLAEACQIRNGTTGPYIGTATTARDLMSVVDALQEDGLLRFYGRALPRTSWLVSIAELKAGMSYGSILGATVAAMFPERMDKIYLDGIANSHEYFNSK